ncbi:DUF3577 domain-containing protein [Saezia sanguinis]|uniref:DUF3577 domain-containing protein n=1 Tax=Saezia sanguinis TaxID=1965230 RepID=UPI0030279787
MNTSTQPQNDNGKKYNNTLFTGLGFLNRARFVDGHQGEPYWAVTVAGLSGEIGKAKKLYVDCNIKGEDAQKLIALYKEDINNRDIKVTASFGIGDLEIGVYTAKDGTVKPCCKGNLLYLSYIKVGENIVYRSPKKAQETLAENQATSEPSPETQESQTPAPAAA